MVLTAPPGSGKTTCVPPALMHAHWLDGRKIVMLEPRRLAARSCAEYIAGKLGERVGESVGYRVRLERKVSSATRLEIVTEGMLAQKILADPELHDVGLLIFDEFHERSLQCDLAFALALEVRRALRPDLRILVMSATLSAEEVASHMGDAVVVRAEGRMFPVKTRYLGDVSMMAAVESALRETDGDVLCFLPGEGEIRRALEASSQRPHPDVEWLPLYGSLPKEEQDRVFATLARRKVIFSTSIAETSVTIPGITCVIDSGLMRVSRFSAATGMTGLVTLPLTLDRAEQRRGRAGRVRPGVCYRLWTAESERSRPSRAMPEILDSDLCQLVLVSSAWGALNREALPWLTPPPAAAWEKSVGLLRLLGALDDQGRLTAKGERMASLPIHPRLANMMQMVKGRRNRETASILAAIIEESPKFREIDIRKLLDESRESRHAPWARRVLRLAERFQNAAGDVTEDAPSLTEGAMLAYAYPDRIAENRGNATFRMVCGRGARLDSTQPLSRSPFLVCCELDDRLGDAAVFRAAPIDLSEIEDIFAGDIRVETSCVWDRRTDRVSSLVRRKLGAMTVSEGADSAASGEAVTRALMEGVRQKGVENLPCWTTETLRLKARMNFLSRRCGWAVIGDDELIAALSLFVPGMNSWKDLSKVDMMKVLEYALVKSGHTRLELDRLAPARMSVPSGSHIVIDYSGDEPTASVKLQECFGMMSTPTVADGSVAVVMTLLSPAQRPVQITKDLANFWREGYPLVRKDLRGRYPKHYWPDDPFTAIPTRRTRPK